MVRVLLFLTLFLSLVTPLGAQNVARIELAIAPSERDLSEPVLTESLEQTQRLFRRLGVTVQFNRSRIRRVNNPTSLEEAEDQGWRFTQLMRNKFPWAEYTMVITGPIILPDGRMYHYGEVDGGCLPGAWRRSHANVWTTDDRRDPVGIATNYIAHEVGHLLGASHDFNEPVNLMGYFPWESRDVNLRWSTKSRREIRACFQ